MVLVDRVVNGPVVVARQVQGLELLGPRFLRLLLCSNDDLSLGGGIEGCSGLLDGRKADVGEGLHRGRLATVKRNSLFVRGGLFLEALAQVVVNYLVEFVRILLDNGL